MTTTKITFEEIRDLLPKTTSLYYVDYQDSLDEHQELLQECIENNCFDALYENIHEWYMDSPYYAFEYLNKELHSDIMNKFDLDDDEVDEIMEEFEDEIRDHYYEVDDSNVLKDLLRNTSTLIAHYDTGYYMDSGSWNWSNAEVRLERIKIKQFLNIKDSGYDAPLDMMIMQASGGGQLNIYFELDIEDFINNSNKTIIFSDFQIGIVNHYEGSGDILETEIKGDITLPLNTSNIFLEKSIKYNWTYSIAGMCRDWCKSTVYSFSDEGSEIVVEDSKQAELNKQEQGYNDTFKKGSCTFGDMDVNRHRNLEYTNDYPCGNKCKKCGTFWID